VAKNHGLLIILFASKTPSFIKNLCAILCGDKAQNKTP
jgi:hypothetical protein